MKNPNCHKPSCGLDGKFCPDCVTYKPPQSKLYFATKDFYFAGTTYTPRTAWFTKTASDLRLYDKWIIDLPDEWLRICLNPAFPSDNVLAFRLDKLFPGSPRLNTLFICYIKSAPVLASDYWNGSWKNSRLKETDLREWKDYFTRLKPLLKPLYKSIGQGEEVSVI